MPMFLTLVCKQVHGFFLQPNLCPCGSRFCETYWLLCIWQQCIIYVFFIHLVCETSISSNFRSSSSITPSPFTSSHTSFRFIRYYKHTYGFQLFILSWRKTNILSWEVCWREAQSMEAHRKEEGQTWWTLPPPTSTFTLSLLSPLFIDTFSHLPL